MDEGIDDAEFRSRSRRAGRRARARAARAAEEGADAENVDTAAPAGGRASPSAAAPASDDAAPADDTLLARRQRALSRRTGTDAGDASLRLETGASEASATRRDVDARPEIDVRGASQALDGKLGPRRGQASLASVTRGTRGGVLPPLSIAPHMMRTVQPSAAAVWAAEQGAQSGMGHSTATLLPYASALPPSTKQAFAAAALVPPTLYEESLATGAFRRLTDAERAVISAGTPAARQETVSASAAAPAAAGTSSSVSGGPAAARRVSVSSAPAAPTIDPSTPIAPAVPMRLHYVFRLAQTLVMGVCLLLLLVMSTVGGAQEVAFVFSRTLSPIRFTFYVLIMLSWLGTADLVLRCEVARALAAEAASKASAPGASASTSTLLLSSGSLTLSSTRLLRAALACNTLAALTVFASMPMDNRIYAQRSTALSSLPVGEPGFDVDVLALRALLYIRFAACGAAWLVLAFTTYGPLEADAAVAAKLDWLDGLLSRRPPTATSASLCLEALLALSALDARAAAGAQGAGALELRPPEELARLSKAAAAIIKRVDAISQNRDA